MNQFNPELISGMLEKYSHMSEEELFQEAKKLKKHPVKRKSPKRTRKNCLHL